MALNCPEKQRLEKFLSQNLVAEEERRDWIRHVESCAECRPQWEAHLDLKVASATLPSPALPPDFNFRLRARIRRDAAPRLDRRAVALLRTYWLLASAFSIYLIVKIDWPARLKDLGVPLLLVALVVALTLVEMLSVDQARRIAVWLRLAKQRPECSPRRRREHEEFCI